MIDKKYWNDIKETMSKTENRTKYENLNTSNTKEENLIKFHIKRVKEYFEMQDEDKENEKYKNDCSVSIKEINSYFKDNGWE